MSTSVGTISLDMVLNGTKFKKQLGNMQNQANSASQKMAASFKKIGASVAAAFSTAMIAKFGKSCIDLGSDLAEVQNVVDVTFTTMSDKVNEWAVNAQKAYGLSETMAKKYVGTFGSMAEAFGFTEQQSYDMATSLTGLTGDVASFYNLSQDLAYTKLKSVFSGETETLKDLGIVMTQSALDNYALANGYTKTVKEMTEAEKVTLRYNFVLGQLKNATGDFTRTQDSWANQTRILSLRFDSLKATIGQGLINAFTPVIKVVNSLIDRLSTVSEKFKALTEQIFGNAGGSTAGGVDTAMADSASSAESLTNEANNSSAALDSVADSAERAKKSVAGFDKLNVLSKDSKTETNSTTPATTTQNQSSGNNLTSAMSKSVDKLVSSWNSKGQKVIDSIKKAFNSVKGVVESIGNSWKRVWNNGSGSKLLNNIKDLLKHCFDNVGYIANAFKRAWDKAGLGDSVIQSIIDRANSLIGLIDVIAEDFAKIWNNGTGERIWSNILNIIKNCNNYVSTLRDKIKLAWEKGGAGEKIWNTILGIVEDITGFLNDMSQIRLEWLESLDLSPIVTAVSNLGEAFRELLKACGDKLKTVYQKVLLPLAKWTIEKAVPKLVEMLAGALKGISEIIKKISDKTLYAIAGGIAAVGTAVIVFKMGSAIAAGINKVKDAVKVFITTVSAHPILAIAGAIGGLVTAVTTYNQLEWSNSEAGKFATEIDIIKGQLEKTTQGITDNLESTLETLDGLYADNTLIDEYQQKLDDLLGKAKLTPEEQSQLQTIVTYFNDNVPGFDKTWKDYVKISDGGKVNLKGDLEEVQGAIDKTIKDYQSLAIASAFSDLKSQNAKDIIESQKELRSTKTEINKKKEEVDKAYKAWQTALKEEADAPTINSLESDYTEKNKKLQELNSTYNDTVANMNKLIMTGDDLLDVQKALNGDYSDAAAVMMALNEGYINLEDVQKSQWKSLSNLEKAAKDTGKNTVIGLVEGTKEYKDALVTNSNGLATTVLSEYDKGMGIHSPSKEMHKRGVWTVQGLINGFSSIVDKVVNPIKSIIERVQTALNPIKTVFSNVFGGIWGVIQTPMNFVLGKVEDFVNTFNSGLSRVGGKILNGVDVAANIVADVARPNMKLPRLAKGGIVKAPTLAVVGDNAGANIGDPEVISPLSKLQSMIKTSSGEDVVILKQMLDYLKRIYEMFVIFRNNGGNHYEFVAKINGSEIFDEMVRQNELYKKRHGGKSAFL